MKMTTRRRFTVAARTLGVELLAAAEKLIGELEAGIYVDAVQLIDAAEQLDKAEDMFRLASRMRLRGE